MRQAVLDLIRETADAGAAVLLSSHDLSEVSAICGRAGILREGRLVEMAPITQIVQQGEHRLKVWFADGGLCPDVPLADCRACGSSSASRASFTSPTRARRTRS